MQLGNTSDAEVPLVHSISYGEPEADLEPAAMRRLNLEFAKLALRG